MSVGVCCLERSCTAVVLAQGYPCASPHPACSGPPVLLPPKEDCRGAGPWGLLGHLTEPTFWYLYKKLPKAECSLGECDAVLQLRRKVKWCFHQGLGKCCGYGCLLQAVRSLWESLAVVTTSLQAAPCFGDWLAEPRLAVASLRHPLLPASQLAYPPFSTPGLSTGGHACLPRPLPLPFFQPGSEGKSRQGGSLKCL